jgi:hypothetical protein
MIDPLFQLVDGLIERIEEAVSLLGPIHTDEIGLFKEAMEVFGYMV